MLVLLRGCSWLDEEWLFGRGAWVCEGSVCLGHRGVIVV
jgi:hypothetical protein